MQPPRPAFLADSPSLRFRRLAWLGLLAVGSAMPAAAAIVLTLPTASTAGSLVITEDIEYTITTTGNLSIIIFDEWVTNDGTRSRITADAFSAAPISYTINAGPPAGGAVSSLVDNTGAVFNHVNHNDGYLFFLSDIPVAAGNTFTLLAATYELSAGSLPVDFNPQANQTFTGNSFLAGRDGARLSSDTSAGAVPEPSQLVLLTGALLPLALRRRRK